MKRWSRIRPWIWLAVPLLGVTELGAHFYFRHKTPKLDDYRALTPVVTKLKQAEDLVAIAPYWAEPNLRWALGDALMPLRDVARPDELRYAAAVEVRLLGHASQFAGWHVDATRTVGQFTVERRTNPAPQRVSFDFVDALNPEHSEVALRKGGSADKPCPYNRHAKVSNGALGGHPTFPEQRFECGGGEWNFAGVTVIEDQNYLPRRCIWAAPADNQTKIVRFPRVTLNQQIVTYTGVPYLVDREAKGTPIDLEVTVDGDTVGTTSHKDGDGWQRFDVATNQYANAVHAVEFRVTSKRARGRAFCFYADIR